MPAPSAAIQAETESPNYGEVFTRRWVVDLILDLSGYTPDKDLAKLKVVEPACGSGAFLIALVERLVESAKRHGRPGEEIGQAIVARDLQAHHVAKSRAVARGALATAGFDAKLSRRLARKWVRQGDFLLDPPAEQSADFVVGNPPYIRLEEVPPQLSEAYREACPTMGGRSDVYVGFYERALVALREEGVLGYICADRWMRNAYGARLRELIGREYSVDTIISMTGVDAFEDEVDAYPAVTIVRRGIQTTGPMAVVADEQFSPKDHQRLSRIVKARKAAPKRAHFQATPLPNWFHGRAGWPQGTPTQLAAIAEFEARLPTLEDENTDTRVGIGLATGADRIFITSDANLVEPERLLPLATVRDISGGSVDWSGHYLVNPWTEDGLVELHDWPQLNRYLERHKTVLSKRHTAKSGKWHKTIDRVIEGLVQKPKLYLPDFKESVFPVLDSGQTYPHHNLYWITSGTWDLEVLGGILMSDIANLFINAYSIRMRGGYLRFQAQYLRRIRLPDIGQVDQASEEALRTAFRARDQETATAVARSLYGVKAPTA